MPDKEFPELIAHIEAQGSFLQLRLSGYKSVRKGGGGGRGIIRVFSQASRRRLIRFMARLKTRKIRATFLTLTFTEVHSNEFAKKALKRFTMRLRRAFGCVSGVWRMEFQERGAIHFHMLLFNLPFWKQQEVQETWEACTTEGRSIVDIRLVHGARSVMSYIAKYIAKKDEREALTSLEDGSYQHGGEKKAGRFWGWINKELLPLGQKMQGVLTDRQTIKSLSSFMWALIGSDNPYNSISASLLADNAMWLCERAIEEGGCLLDEWEYTTRDHCTPKPTYHPSTDRFTEDELRLDNVPTIGRSYKAERSELVQPCISGWVARSSKASSVSRALPYWIDGCTFVPIYPVSKE